jgi:hypothetical protein
MEQLARPKTSSLAIVSLVFSLLGCLAPIGIICGHLALSKIKKSAGLLTGGGIALAGTIVGYFMTVLSIFMAIPILFVGVNAWKKGADRATCILNQRNVQKAVRGYQAANNLKSGDHLDLEVALKAYNLTMPKCPTGCKYTISETIPAVGDLVIECDQEGSPSTTHKIENHKGW